MEKLQHYFAENPGHYGFVIVAFGIVFLVSAIKNSRGLFEKDINHTTTDLHKIDGMINILGRKRVRIMVGIIGAITIIAGIVWLVIYECNKMVQF